MSRTLEDDVLPRIQMSTNVETISRHLAESRRVPHLVIARGQQENGSANAFHRDADLIQLDRIDRQHGIGITKRDRPAPYDIIRKIVAHRVWQERKRLAAGGPCIRRRSQDVIESPKPVVDALGDDTAANHTHHRADALIAARGEQRGGPSGGLRRRNAGLQPCRDVRCQPGAS